MPHLGNQTLNDFRPLKRFAILADTAKSQDALAEKRLLRLTPHDSHTFVSQVYGRIFLMEGKQGFCGQVIQVFYCRIFEQWE